MRIVDIRKTYWEVNLFVGNELASKFSSNSESTSSTEGLDGCYLEKSEERL
jgi:hypothetical protein